MKRNIFVRIFPLCVFQRKLPSDSEVLNKPKLVYTVSAREFWNQKHLTPEETEIPELRDYLRMIYLKEKQKLVKDYVTEVWGIHRLAKNFGSKPQPEDRIFQKSGVKELMLKNVSSLEKHIEKCFAEIRQPLCESVENARRNYKSTVKQLLTRDEGYRGYHKTLKAVCLKDGIYASKKFLRIDFNESLVKPFYDKVDCIFGSIFRIQNATRSSLWSHLEMFKNEVQSKIRQTGKDNHLPNNWKIDIFIKETNMILKKLEKQILCSKLNIYQSLCMSIQSDLKPHYKAASEVKGHGSCEQMKTILMRGIENEVQKQMFEKAKSKMEWQFCELKRYILETLKEEISIVFNLVFLQEERAAVHLTDIENECKEIHEIYLKLHDDH
ncbi:nuclear GTPase SLIP-GC [Heteronotia binoei]|uniref:nuclear GTPase SLIP-GC n=1 Tax=Heteronotia binoei TaxID=13085 RepID=UPI0029309EC9|nr:nuclear GTPase SLIP-GC [Heteronotia binoei]